VDELATLQMRYDLTSLLARILRLLAQNTAVTTAMIEDEHGLTKDAPIAIHRLRRRLTSAGITVLFRRGVGYWIEPEDRQRVIAAMQPDQMRLPLGDGGTLAAGGPPQQG
jgi:hypothetical protein